MRENLCFIAESYEQILKELQKHKEEKELNTSIGIMQIPHGKLDFSINQIETTLND